MPAGGNHGVAQQTGDGHGPDAPRYRRNRRSDGAGGIKIDIADQLGFVGAFFRGGHAVDAHIDNHGAGFDPIAFDHFRAADSGDKDIRFAATFFEVRRALMGHGDGAAFIQQ